MTGNLNTEVIEYLPTIFTMKILALENIITGSLLCIFKVQLQAQCIFLTVLMAN